MNKEQFLLTKIAEECGEVAEEFSLAIQQLMKVQKIALKAQQFGMNETHHSLDRNNMQRLYQELDDLSAIIEMLEEHVEEFNYKPSRRNILNKKHKVEKYLAYSVDLGKVEPSTETSKIEDCSYHSL